MAITLDNFANEMATEFGEQYSNPDVALLFQRWTQEVFGEIVSSGRWASQNGFQSVTFTPGTASYTLDAEVSEVKTVTDLTAAAEIAYFEVERLISRGEDLTASGVPTVWFYDGIDTTSVAFKVRFWKVPNDSRTVQVHYLKQPPTLALDENIPLPGEFLDVLRLGVRALGRMNENDEVLYKDLRERFEGRLQLLAARFQPKQRNASRLRIKQLPAVNQSTVATGQ